MKRCTWPLAAALARFVAPVRSFAWKRLITGRLYALLDAAVHTPTPSLLFMLGLDEHHVKIWTINPKAVSLGQLYGQDDPLSREWTDGVLAVAFRCVREEHCARVPSRTRIHLPAMPFNWQLASLAEVA